jgi:hypothetical protein
MGDPQRPADGVSRRRFLTGAGGTLLALPLVSAATTARERLLASHHQVPTGL